MRTYSRKIAVLAGLVGAMMIAGVAFAAWTSTNTGTGEAKSTSHTDLSTTGIVSASKGDDLYPGATKSFTVTIKNPNPYPVKVTAITAGTSNLVNTTCAAGSVTSDAVADAAGIAQDGVTDLVIAANNGTGVYRLTSHMIADPAPACESQSFTLPLTATLVSAAS